MIEGQAKYLRELSQLRADAAENLELDRWNVVCPMRASLLRDVDEAARRAESFARLEYALTHLP